MKSSTEIEKENDNASNSLKRTFISSEKRKLTEKEEENLFCSIENGNIDIAKNLILIMEDVNDKICDEVILHICCLFERVELVKYLIEFGADVNKLDSTQDSPLMKIAFNGNFDIAQLLIDAGANLNFEDKFGNSLLSLATSYNHLKVFELLISSGIDIDRYGENSLACAAFNGNIEIAQKLIELNVSVNYLDSKTGCTPLHSACRNNHMKMVELLMSKGADESIKDVFGRTVLESFDNIQIKEVIFNYNSKFVLK